MKEEPAMVTASIANPAATMRGIIPLRELTRADHDLAGSKAANLGELASAGFRVPDGFVVIDAPDTEILAAASLLGDQPLAVRSSGVAEDLADASFAGQYETILNVRGSAELLEAIRRCRDSARSARVQHYRAARAAPTDERIAVLVQRMLAPRSAGVAFTANPVTGARDEIVITAASGLGERVVSGEASGDEWLVRAGHAVCRRCLEQAIDATQAAAIAELARRVDHHFGAPQDIEWAVEDGQVYLLQARPLTALPEPIVWPTPGPGYWLRNLRLGEWLPEPLTPLFRDWLLERIEEGTQLGMRATAGAAVPFPHATVNGWYYAAAPRLDPLEFVRAIVESRGKIVGVLVNAVVRVGSQPEAADRKLLRRLADEWRHELLPGYQRLVQAAERRVESATADELAGLVDALGRAAGEQFCSLAIVGGAAWKMEGCLARFVRQHLRTSIDGGVLVLLRGLAGIESDVPAHAVQSLDWYWPTAGELGTCPPEAALANRQRRLADERRAAEAACRAGLADRPKLLARFEAVLEVTQRYATIREQQARWLTLGWPVLRRCALRLGERLSRDGLVEQPEDVFFLVGGELAARTPLHDLVRVRRSEWERQRRLVAPLSLGTPSRLVEGALRQVVNAVRTPTAGRIAEGSIVGHPASPGRARGRVCVVHGPEDFDRFQAGEVLVARATAPAWTPLFSRAAAVVTDGGSLAAHASLVAREFGIPAVVGTGDATVRLSDGQVVVVDGSAGVVEISEL
jgi:rifampicin phosphotransferase